MPRLFFVIFVLLLGGCASITGDHTQPVSVFAVCAGSAAPVKADCVLENDKGRKLITSPGTVAVPRSTSDLTIQCMFGTSTSNSVVVTSKSDGRMLGNIVAGGFVGAAVDAGTGAAFNYPSSVTVLIDCFPNE